MRYTLSFNSTTPRCLKITEKVSFLKIASEASYVTPNSVVRKFDFYRTKIDENCQLWKIQMRLLRWFSNNVKIIFYILFCRLKTVWMTMSWTVSVGCTAVLICPQISNSHVREKNLTEGTCTIRIISGSPFSWLLMPDFFTFQDASGWLLKEDSCPTWSKVSSKKSSFSFLTWVVTTKFRSTENFVSSSSNEHCMNELSLVM